MLHVIGQDRSGRDVTRIDLERDGLSASILTCGAILQDLRLASDPRPLVLGYPELAPYLRDPNYFGAIVGRCANRITDGRVWIDGRHYQLDLNENEQTHLHGGRDGVSHRNWQIAEHASSFVVLEDMLPDGHMGYPGTLTVQVRFSLKADQALDIDISATTDAPTLCNFAHHSYFNFSDAPSIAGHGLQVLADQYLELDPEGLPTGKTLDVQGTRFDLRGGVSLGAADDFDHNFCLSDAQLPLRNVARLTAPDGGLAMQVATTEPGLQVYTGQGITSEGAVGHHGRPYGAFAGIALETQGWPDAPNHSHFPSVRLDPNETYRHATRYRFLKP